MSAQKVSTASIATRSLRHYWRMNLMLALGIAAATAVLTGALIVGDSMRSSLRNLALDRLGGIDEMIVGDGFFRQDLAAELAESKAFQNRYERAEPAILFPGATVELGDEFGSDGSPGLRRANSVAVFGIAPTFWALGDDELKAEPIAGRQVIINQALADQLQIEPSNAQNDPLTLRIPKPGQLPTDSALGKKSELVESLVELQVTQILPNRSVARFGLRPSQLDLPNIFLPIELLGDALVASGLGYKSGPQANAIFLGGQGDQPPTKDEAAELFQAFRPSLADLGIGIKKVEQKKPGIVENVFEYYTLSTDRLVLSSEIVKVVLAAFPNAKPVFAYLANDIRLSDQPAGIPFSTVAAIDIDDQFSLVDVAGDRIDSLANGEVVLNEWAARDLNAKVGDSVQLKYFEPETTHGSQVESSVDLRVASIAKLAEPDHSFAIRGREVIPAKYKTQTPTLANDPELTPEVPGLTDAASIEAWDLPFPTPGIRDVDDDYWNNFRTTPKAFISLSLGQNLWGSRFGNVTSFRIPVAGHSVAEVEEKLEQQLASMHAKPGFSLLPIKRNAIAASSGATPFDVLFLALSMFVIGAALLLVSLLLRLTLNGRASELGTLLAVGFDQRSLARLLLIELLLVAVIGTLIGIGLGVGYAAAMILGLRTWWLGAIASPILELRVSPMILAVGALCSLLICFLTIYLTVRGTRRQAIRNLLAGILSTESGKMDRSKSWRKFAVVALVIAAAGLASFATMLGGEPQAGAFMGAGFMVLAALLLAVRIALGRSSRSSASQSLSLNRLAAISGKRNPLRSTLTIALVAVASFLIIAVSSFRLTPSESGTGGFDLIANSDQPIFESLGEVAGMNLSSYSMRVKAGDDASCTNLYQSSQPQVLGVSQQFVESFESGKLQFRWSATVALESEANNPWQMLNRIEDDGAIPVVIDKNTANYSLKIFAVGGDYVVNFDSGEQVVFRVVGFLENSILQGSLIVAEEQFVRAFPLISGYRQFLIRRSDPLQDNDQVASGLESRYSDEGFDAEIATDKLARYQRVQNTYISTFQTLGGLGLLLGTFGLAAVQIRSVFERRKELGLMRSVGFSRVQLSRMVLLENCWLLMTGLAIGGAAALVTTVPHYFIGEASIPWIELGVLFVIILLCGATAAWLASRIISKMPLIESLRAT